MAAEGLLVSLNEDNPVEGTEFYSNKTQQSEDVVMTEDLQQEAQKEGGMLYLEVYTFYVRLLAKHFLNCLFKYDLP